MSSHKRPPPLVALFTDFGWRGPYLGQMKAVLAQAVPGASVIDLFADAPQFDPRAGAYLLAGYAPELPVGTVFVCVVDPGVGTARAALVLEVDGRWFVGPDNGLLEAAAARGRSVRRWRITWRPERLSASFHGRDLFAPVGAMLARGEAVPGVLQTEIPPRWPTDLPEVVYIDHYGNAVTGTRAVAVEGVEMLRIAGQAVPRGRTFGEVPQGAAFWYESSSGLVEFAVNRGRADEVLGLGIGTAFEKA